MKYKILVADDYESNLAVIESIFEESNGELYDILYAHNGMSACEMTILHQPDLIIMDWEMPKMSGIDAVRYLKGRDDTKHIPIIMTTAFTSSEHLEKALKTGATDYVRKPIDEVELLARVNSALQIVTSYKKIMQQKNEIEEKTNKLEKALLEIEKSNNKIISSINYAKRIQEAMLPPLQSFKGLLADSFVLFKPRDLVSGDFYWLSEKNQKLFVAVVDCTGHGVPGAFMSMLGSAYLGQIIDGKSISSPNLILQELNEAIKGALNQNETNNRDGMEVAICVIDREAQKLEFAGAKLPLIYIKDKELMVIKGDRTSIGGSRNVGEFTKHVVELDPQNPMPFYIFSDGYQDQFNSDMHAKFTAKRFKKLLLRVHKQPFEEQGLILNNIIQDWMRHSRQVDDILVLGFQA
ncbi:MAG: response regulator [Cytophagales bacterium]|nr:MAG: response regulator [Cytophagales bacterium]TAF59431.1 MAG: response regulator [Cytophagales bacterium]